MCQATLMTCFFKIVRYSLEAKTRTTYENLTAFGQENNQDAEGEEEALAQPNQSSYKSVLMRYGKRCLSFIGADESRMLLIVWTVVGARLMIIHFRFFKHCTWYSHREGETKQYGVSDFCPRADGKIRKNPATEVLSELACMLFDPNGQGRPFLRPLHAYAGASIHWSEQVHRVLQKCLVLAMCRIWRQLVHRFLCSPWTLACIFDPSETVETRTREAQTFWRKPKMH